MRIVALGSQALVEGFSLLGAETYADAGAGDEERVLKSLVRSREKALVFIEHTLAREKTPTLSRVRREGGRIVVSEVPPLHTPADYQPPVEELVRRVLGPSALEERE